MFKNLSYASHIVIAAHGSFLASAGKGSWGYALQVREGEQVIDQTYKIEWSDRTEYYGMGGKLQPLTDTRLEMMALCDVLSEYGEGDCDSPLVIMTDNKEIYDGMTKWLEYWREDGWKCGESFIDDADYWIDLERLTEGKVITWVWMKGGVQSLLHDRADVLIRGVTVKGKLQGERLSA